MPNAPVIVFCADLLNDTGAPDGLIPGLAIAGLNIFGSDIIGACGFAGPVKATFVVVAPLGNIPGLPLFFGNAPI
jgi:hypothetical protein